MRDPRKGLGIALGILGVLLFGGPLPATRLTVVAIEPLFLTSARAAIAGIAGITVVIVLQRPIPAISLWRELVLAGLCTFVGFPLFTALAMASVPAAHGGVVLGILPLATAAAAAIVTRERPAAGFWLVGLVGALIVIAFVLSEGTARTFGLGDLFLLGAVIAGAFGYALSGRLSLIMSGWEVVSWRVVAFLPISALLTFAFWPRDLASIPLPAWAGLAYVGLVSQYLVRLQRGYGHEWGRSCRATYVVAAFHSRHARLSGQQRTNPDHDLSLRRGSSGDGPNRSVHAGASRISRRRGAGGVGRCVGTATHMSAAHVNHCSHYLASGSGRSWNRTARGRLPVPPSR